MEFVKLVFRDGTVEVVKSKLETIPYFAGLFNLNPASKIIELPFSSVFFIPLLFRKLDSYWSTRVQEEIIDSTLHMTDYLSWNDGMNYFLSIYGKHISMPKSFSILYNCNLPIARQLIKYHRNVIVDLIPTLARKEVVNLCELLQHSELSSLIIAVYKWSGINGDVTIWNDISEFSYGISNQTLNNLLDLSNLITYEVVRRNLKSVQILRGIAELEETQIRLDWSDAKDTFTIDDERSEYSNMYYHYCIVDNKLRITSKSHINLIIESGDNYVYVKLDHDEFDYLFLYDNQYVNIIAYE